MWTHRFTIIVLTILILTPWVSAAPGKGKPKTAAPKPSPTAVETPEADDSSSSDLPKGEDDCCGDKDEPLPDIEEDY